MTKNYRSTLDKCLEDPEFRAEWNALESEFEIAKTSADSSQTAKGIVQKGFTDAEQVDIRKPKNRN